MERQLRALISRLLDRGVDVVVVSRTLGLSEHPRLRWLKVPGPARPFALAYPWFAVAASIIVALRTKGILHSTGAIVFNRAHVTTVHYVHNRRGRRVSRNRRETLPYRLNAAVVGVMSRAGEWLVYSSPGRSGTLVAVSDPLAEELRIAFPARASSIRVVGNGVDTDQFRPDPEARGRVREELGLADDKLLALFVGSEWRGKGAHIAVAALGDAPEWHLAVVGEGSRAELDDIASRLRVQERLLVIGEVSNPERYYAAADAFVLPSSYESFSLASFEAAASGLPVIATDVGAISEIVEAGGGLFTERTPEAVAAALLSLEGDPEGRTRMAARARACVFRFDWRQVVEEYVGLYQSPEPRPQGVPEAVGAP
jgi:glycosyltransferase involved in cell wall biosynthesis